MSDTNFYSLPIVKMRPETDQAVTVFFRPPAEDREAFKYAAGQYLTLKFVINGKEERRAYSMCSAPHEGDLAVTVKRVQGGVVSNHIPDFLEEGDTVEVMPPAGRFMLRPDAAARRDIYLFGAGSGITPLMSILRAVLEEEPKSHVYLLYGNRDEDNIIFEAELKELESKYAGQLTVEHTLSRPKKYGPGGLKGLFKKAKPKWRGRIGRVDIPAVQEFLRRFPSQTDTQQYFICGPGKMIDNAEQALLGLGADPEAIHTERFVSANEVKKAKPSGGAVDHATVAVKLGGKDLSVTLKPGQSILDGLLENGATPPYSCLAGACSTCMAKVEKGGVRMEACYALDDDEVAEGYVLTCQSHPTTPSVSIDFDV